MPTNRKRYAFLYLSEQINPEKTKEIIGICTNLDIDYEMIEQPRDFNMWAKMSDSINPSLFISDIVISDEEFHALDSKLEDSVILLFGEHTKEKYMQNVEMKSRELSNLVKRCDDYAGFINYITVLISKKFKTKVLGTGNLSAPTTPNNKETKKAEPTSTNTGEVPENNLKEVTAEELATNTGEGQGQQPTDNLISDLIKEGEEKISVNKSESNFQTAEDELDDTELSDNLKFITEAVQQNPSITTPAPIHVEKQLETIKVNKVIPPVPIELEGNKNMVTTEQLHYEEVPPYHIRARKIQKKMASQRWEGHHTVGVWSPLHRMGVTSFVINFALFLAEHKIQTAVLEGLTEQHALKSWLERYTSVPNDWISYAKALLVDSDEEWKWTYQNVMFLPLDKEDTLRKWDANALATYMTTTNKIEMTLVDLPTGKMTSYTEDSLHYLNELWIVLDDSTQEILAWKEYIQAIKKRVNIPIYVVFNKAYSFSQVGRLCKEIQLPLLVQLPPLYEETMLNYYENKPLYLKQEVRAKLEPKYMEISKHLFGKEFHKNSELFLKAKRNWSFNFLKTLKG